MFTTAVRNLRYQQPHLTMESCNTEQVRCIPEAAKKQTKKNVVLFFINSMQLFCLKSCYYGKCHQIDDKMWAVKQCLKSTIVAIFSYVLWSNHSFDFSDQAENEHTLACHHILSQVYREGNSFEAALKHSIQSLQLLDKNALNFSWPHATAV